MLFLLLHPLFHRVWASSDITVASMVYQTCTSYMSHVHDVLCFCVLQNIENKRTRELTEEELTTLRDELEKYTVEGDLRRFTNLNIKRLKEIGCYRGRRHVAVGVLPLLQTPPTRPGHLQAPAVGSKLAATQRTSLRAPSKLCLHSCRGMRGGYARLIVELFRSPLILSSNRVPIRACRCTGRRRRPTLAPGRARRSPLLARCGVNLHNRLHTFADW